MKSLFDFKENHKFKKSETDVPSSNSEQEKPKIFKFTTENLFDKKEDRGLVVKPLFSSGNPFMIPGSSSTLFTTGKSLFDTSNLGNTFKPFQPNKPEEKE